MRSTKSRSIAAAIAATLLAPLFVALTPGTASALPPGASSSCKNAQNQSAELGHFPAMPASQSTLKVSCLFESDIDSPDYMVSSAFTIHDFENVVYHNGAARTVTATGTSGTAVLTITTAGASSNVALGTWVNRAITGTGIAPRTFVTSIVGSTVNLSENLTAAGSGPYKIDNAGGARSIDSGTLTGGANTFTTAAAVGTSANFSTAVNNSDIGLSVSGTRIPGGCTIATVVNANSATMSCNANGAGVFNNQVVTIGGTMLVTSARTVDDALRDNGVNQRVTTVAARISNADIGLPVTNNNGTTDFDAGSVVTVIINAALGRFTVGGPCSPGCVNTAGTGQVTIGDPTGTATATGDTVVSLGVQLDLSPTLVAGSQACSEEEPEGFVLAGTLYQPGNFQSPLFGSTIPTGVRVLGQILFDTATTSDFAGYIVQRPAASAGDPIGSDHYDVVFPSLPLSSALCADSPSYDSPGLAQSITVLGQTASQARLLSGVGRPGTAQLRAIQDSTVGYGTTLYLDSQVGPAFTPAINFERTCNYPAINEVKFTCGNG